MRFVKLATVAGLVGLAVFHADDIARVLSFGTSTFSNAINVAPGKGSAKQ